jgi:hypothetical protein
MVDLFSETPFLLQVIPSLSKSSVLAINRLGQLTVLVSAILALFPEEVSYVLQLFLRAVSFIVKAVVRLLGFSWGKNGWEFAWPPEADGSVPDEHIWGDFELRKQFIAAIVLLVVQYAVSSISWSWYPNPSEIFFRAFSLWSETEFTFISVVGSLIGCIWRLIAVVPVALLKIVAVFLYGVSWLVVCWAAACFLSAALKHLSSILFRSVIALVLMIGAIAVVITT